MMYKHLQPIKILITGGHLTPALAIIENIQSRHPEWNIVFVGRKTAFEGSNITAEEERIILGYGIPFIGMKTGRIRLHFSFYSLVSLLKIPYGVLQAIFICLAQKPTAIMSFGGYISFPIVLAGFLMGIPIITHEQTLTPGIANRVISAFATVICVSYPQTLTAFGKRKPIFTGLPLRRSIFHPPQSTQLPMNPNKPIIYIMGGTTGSQTINNLIYPILPKLLKFYTLIHQVGRQGETEAKKIRLAIRGDKRKNYIVAAYFDELEHSWILHNLTVAICRGGANTIAELEATQAPSIVIPLPYSHGNEQVLNAERLVDLGRAISLNQSHCTPEILLESIEKMRLKNHKKINGKNNPSYANASDRILESLEAVLKK